MLKVNSGQTFNIHFFHFLFFSLANVDSPAVTKQVAVNKTIALLSTNQIEVILSCVYNKKLNTLFKIHAAPQKRPSLKILTPLQNKTYSEDTKKVKLVCKVESATYYVWYKDGNILETNNASFKVRENKLIIRHFNSDKVGLYGCKGEDRNGNFGMTTAKISLPGMP